MLVKAEDLSEVGTHLMHVQNHEQPITRRKARKLNLIMGLCEDGVYRFSATAMLLCSVKFFDNHLIGKFYLYPRYDVLKTLMQSKKKFPKCSLDEVILLYT